MRFYKACVWTRIVLPLAQKKAHIDANMFLDVKCRDQRAWRKFYKIASEWGFSIGDFVYACISSYQAVMTQQMICEESIDPEAYWFPENTVQDIVHVPEIEEIRL